MKKSCLLVLIPLLLLSCKKEESDDGGGTTKVGSSSLTYKLTIGGEGTGMNQFRRINSTLDRTIAFDNDRIYFADNRNNRIIRYDLNFNPLDWYAALDTSGWLDYVWKIFDTAGVGGCCSYYEVVVKNGKLYGSTNYGINVLKVSDGDRIASPFFGNRLANAAALAVDNSGRIYYMSSDAPEIVRMDEDGNLESGFSIPVESDAISYYSGDCVIDQDDHIYLYQNKMNSSANEYLITKFSESGTKITSWTVTDGLEDYIDIYEDKLYVRCYANQNATEFLLKQYSLDGKHLRNFNLNEFQNADMTMANFYSEFKVVKGHALFVTDDEHKIAVYTMTDQ